MGWEKRKKQKCQKNVRKNREKYLPLYRKPNQWYRPTAMKNLWFHVLNVFAGQNMDLHVRLSFSNKNIRLIKVDWRFSSNLPKSICNDNIFQFDPHGFGKFWKTRKTCRKNLSNWVMRNDNAKNKKMSKTKQNPMDNTMNW